jgi:hypothetical protein
MPKLGATELDGAEIWGTDPYALDEGRGANPDLAKRVEGLQNARLDLQDVLSSGETSQVN